MNVLVPHVDALLDKWRERANSESRADVRCGEVITDIERLRETLLTETQDRLHTAIVLAEGALHGTEPRRGIWTDADYLCAIVATLTGDGTRAGKALLAHSRRTRRRPIRKWWPLG